MPTNSPTAANTFNQDERGAVAIMFALMSFALFFLAGFAIDYGRIQDVRTRISDAIDAASLAAGRAMLDGNLTDSEVIKLATAYFEQNAKSSSKLVTTAKPVIALDRDAGTVDISVQSTVGMTLARVGGFDKINVPVASTATFQQRDIEVGMALDITGSMTTAINGRRKIDSLKSAFKQFTEELFPRNASSSQRVRVALAPYSSAVKLGTYAAAATGGQSVDGCVTERKTSAATDATGEFFVATDGVKNIDPTDPQIYDDVTYDCAKSKPAITPLLDSKDALDRIVDRYNAAGSTGGQLGVQWAWNMISDEWQGTFRGDSAPESYDLVTKGKLMKAVVLLTDGEFNTAYHGKTSSQQAIEMCDAMKTKGVIVFSVGFGLGGDKNAQATLKACATPGVQYFANAESEVELAETLKSFAAQLTKLRLSK